MIIEKGGTVDDLLRNGGREGWGGRKRGFEEVDGLRQLQLCCVYNYSYKATIGR